MKEVTVMVDELIEKVKANREQHEAIFNEAVEGYKNRAVQLLEQHIDRIRRGSLEQVNVILPKPVNHIKDYDRVISMLEMTQRAGTEKIELDDASYAQYVLDDWHWKGQFLTTNTMYAASLQTQHDEWKDDIEWQ